MQVQVIFVAKQLEDKWTMNLRVKKGTTAWGTALVVLKRREKERRWEQCSSRVQLRCGCSDIVPAAFFTRFTSRDTDCGETQCNLAVIA